MGSDLELVMRCEKAPYYILRLSDVKDARSRNTSQTTGFSWSKMVKGTSRAEVKHTGSGNAINKNGLS